MSLIFEENEIEELKDKYVDGIEIIAFTNTNDVTLYILIEDNTELKDHRYYDD